MKILCIGRNYAEHIAELNNERPSEPVVFIKPDTAILKDNEAFYHPDFSNDIHHEVEIVLKINKMGKNIEAKFANKYYEEIGIGIDFTARDIQSKLKEKGLPWEKAKAFNGSAPISGFIPKTEFPDLKNLNFHLEIDGETRQTGNTSMMLWNFDEIIAEISKYFTLKTGDLIFTGTPAGVGKVKIGNKLTAFIEGKEMLSFEIK
ncbi:MULTISPECIES: fumarylacetoacetate hydrolase family protein [unclassified Arcicella]|uniref:fumarylacetoacetate hydrolase family protein n=1 Tax=unclassified Arcicella TaxID=2644986 RepID=UPI0028580933|nr:MULTISPECIES: fumarylacetoacetate hydrolase family protein [unclassified Arcicella]MDR6562567.1 2-keto-4-pentenoate hydratase/2-oxohepta-3-ene-1,7-dioic acid hydratase in catechol pathway [Arcicella sp. BE51]MDR6812654.1 2-keto-4-pentenoate hydratase/2-oxohepta-3-ene-1,7-dioic acid hydratase in catechol pathway [Arcicella sp. BE140]MDR6823966.1 2-keto-4-pentenoate hydratase/2-oxohepta-3-ene-1,7-dioic acid hydratase in catechol pathway [Arcicella sp. BE139]